jgi:hypothetical protein
MSIYAHIDSLNERHLQLSLQIRQAYKQHADDAEIMRMKRKRLRIEEEIERYYGIAAMNLRHRQPEFEKISA